MSDPTEEDFKSKGLEVLAVAPEGERIVWLPEPLPDDQPGFEAVKEQIRGNELLRQYLRRLHGSMAAIPEADLPPSRVERVFRVVFVSRSGERVSAKVRGDKLDDYVHAYAAGGPDDMRAHKGLGKVVNR